MPWGERVGATEGLAAATFYLALASTVGGAMLLARGMVEKDVRGNRFGYVLLAVGGVGIVIAVAAYVVGPRSVLPF